AETTVLLRVAEEVDDLRQLLLRLVDPGDVRERDGAASRRVAPRLRTPETPKHGAAGRAPEEPEEEEQEEDRGAEAEQQALPPRPARVERLGVDHHALR